MDRRVDKWWETNTSSTPVGVIYPWRISFTVMKNDDGEWLSSGSLFVDIASGSFPPPEEGSSSVNLSFSEQLDLRLSSSHLW